MDQGLPEMEEDTMSSQLKKKYSAEKDYKKIVKYAKKRKRNKFAQQIDQYWRRRDFQRLVDKGVINTKIQMKAVKKLLDEIK
jgi:hypothetical protein